MPFDAAPVITSNPFSGEGKRFWFRNREMLGEMRDRGREASPVRLSI